MQREHDQALINLQNKGLEAKEKAIVVMEKYIALYDKIQLSDLQTVANGQPKRIQD